MKLSKLVQQMATNKTEDQISLCRRDESLAQSPVDLKPLGTGWPGSREYEWKDIVESINGPAGVRETLHFPTCRDLKVSDDFLHFR